MAKSVSIEKALTAQVSFTFFLENIADVFLSAKWLRKEIGKKLSLSILVSIKNFHDRIFAILIGISITIFFCYRDRDLDQDFLSYRYRYRDHEKP